MPPSPELIVSIRRPWISALRSSRTTWDRPYPESLLDIATFNPTRDSWNEIDDREIVCLLYDLESAYMHESMKDSGR